MSLHECLMQKFDKQKAREPSMRKYKMHKNIKRYISTRDQKRFRNIKLNIFVHVILSHTWLFHFCLLWSAKAFLQKSDSILPLLQLYIKLIFERGRNYQISWNWERYRSTKCTFRECHKHIDWDETVSSLSMFTDS